MKIKMLIMDVDGTMTDGKIYMGPQGEAMKAFSCLDGLGISHLLPQMGIIPVIITGRSSQITANRAKELHIDHVYQGVSDKLAVMDSLAQELGISHEEIAYIGDDLNDQVCMAACGLTACPANAAQEILDMVDYVCRRSGGNGAVREFIDFIGING